MGDAAAQEMTAEERAAAVAAAAIKEWERTQGGRVPLIGGIPEDLTVAGPGVTLVVPGPPTAASVRAFTQAQPHFEGTITPSGSGSLVARTGGTERKPQYREGDEFDPASWSEEKRARLLKGLSGLGLLTGEWSADHWTEAAADAYYQVLTFANINALDSETALNQLLANPQLIPGVQQAQFQLPTRVLEDPATLQAQVRDNIMGLLGRAPTAQELAQLTSGLAADFQVEYEQETVPLARQDFDQQVAVASGGAAPTATVQQIDPVARLQALLTEKYAPEVQVRRDREESDVNESNLTSLFGSVQAMSVGSG